MILENDRLFLRLVSEEDLAWIHELHSIPEVDRFNTLGIPENIAKTKSVLDNWLSRQKQTPALSYVFVISEKSSNEEKGLIGLHLGKPSYFNAETWYKLFPHAWNRGIATSALHLLLNFAFETLKLHRLEAGCATENLASIRVLEKAGMTREGRSRELLPVRGMWLDNYVYSILEKEFFSGK